MKLFASKLILHPEAQMRLRVRDRYSLHRVVMDLFEPSRRIVDPSGSQPSGIQWVDRGEHLAGREILILSDRMPRDQILPEDVQLATKAISDSFLQHSSYRFALTANPVAVVAGRRVGLSNRAQIRDWLHDRAAANGFQIDFVEISRIGIERFQKESRWISYARADFSGLLSVRDRQAFIRCFSRGIGKGRAFGFGFLQISIFR